MSEELFDQLVSLIEYCTRMAASSLIVGIVCIIGIFITLLCLVVIDRKINYMRKALNIAPEDSPKSAFCLFKKTSKDAAAKADNVIDQKLSHK